MFWVHGAAGSGKSTVATSVAVMLKKSLGGSFFCKRDVEDRRKASNVIPTLVFRLAKALPLFGVHVAEVLGREGGVGSNAISWQAEELLLGPLKKMEKQKDNMPNFVWIIDALDECSAEKERVELVTALCSLHDVAPWLKIFITSRPNKDIHSAFTKAEQSCSITHNDIDGLARYFKRH